MEQPFKAARLPRVCELLGVSRSTVYNLERDDPTFPRRRRISKRAVAWNEFSVLSWVESLPIRSAINEAREAESAVKTAARNEYSREMVRGATDRKKSQ